MVEAIRTHVFAADDTTVPVLAKGETRTGRLWTYVRDDQAFRGRDPPAAVFFYSRGPRASRASPRKLQRPDASRRLCRLRPIASKIGCTAETLRSWVRQAERDAGERA